MDILCMKVDWKAVLGLGGGLTDFDQPLVEAAAGQLINIDNA